MCGWVLLVEIRVALEKAGTRGVQEAGIAGQVTTIRCHDAIHGIVQHIRQLHNVGVRRVAMKIFAHIPMYTFPLSSSQ